MTEERESFRVIQAAPKAYIEKYKGIAWLLARKPWIVPIPGTNQAPRLEENIGATTIELTPDDLGDVDRAAGTATEEFCSRSTSQAVTP